MSQVRLKRVPTCLDQRRRSWRPSRNLSQACRSSLRISPASYPCARSQVSSLLKRILKMSSQETKATWISKVCPLNRSIMRSKRKCYPRLTRRPITPGKASSSQIITLAIKVKLECLKWALLFSNDPRLVAACPHRCENRSPLMLTTLILSRSLAR